MAQMIESDTILNVISRGMLNHSSLPTSSGPATSTIPRTS